MTTKILEYPIERKMPAKLLTGVIFLSFAVLCLLLRPLKNEINWWLDWLFFFVFASGGIFKLLKVLRFWFLKSSFIRNNKLEDSHIQVSNSWLFGPSYVHLDDFSRIQLSGNTVRLFYGSGKYLDLDKKKVGSALHQKLERLVEVKTPGKSIQAYGRSA